MHVNIVKASVYLNTKRKTPNTPKSIRQIVHLIASCDLQRCNVCANLFMLSKVKICAKCGALCVMRCILHESNHMSDFLLSQNGFVLKLLGWNNDFFASLLKICQRTMLFGVCYGILTHTSKVDRQDGFGIC